MTITEFRSTPTFTAGLRALLADPVLQQAVMVLKDHNVPREVELDDAEPIASARRHSRCVGWNNALVALLALAEPLAPPAPEEEPDYGASNEE